MKCAARDAEADKFRIHYPRCNSTYIDVYNSREFVRLEPKIRVSYKSLSIYYHNSEDFSSVNVPTREVYTEEVNYKTIVCDHCGFEFAQECSENGAPILIPEYV